ncbi:hypothetical protein CEXT_353441 [Caerostris extrusa]|uniref:Uncharacterized protein n=1 Tax=Caerostris extrusa TaxID=172846 RepID=A0AAV4QEF2_CAEEX|nr:hypothetical protein CEXT_353441 [Caerostris extrusa]
MEFLDLSYSGTILPSLSNSISRNPSENELEISSLYESLSPGENSTNQDKTEFESKPTPNNKIALSHLPETFPRPFIDKQRTRHGSKVKKINRREKEVLDADSI